jgi:hypothetical protein
MNRTATDPAVERYLERVRVALRGVPRRQADDILLELHGHIVGRVESTRDVEAALESLGDPAEIAQAYRDEGVVARSECARAPLAILHGLVLLRRRSRASWAMFAFAMLGYTWAIALAAASVEKLLSPRDVGLWQSPTAFLPLLTVDGGAPPGSRELLGWWFVPAAAAAFAVLFFATNRLGHWWIRRCRTANRAAVVDQADAPGMSGL